MSEITCTGNTVDEAILEGCRILGVAKDDCSIEILELPARRLFRKIPAKVRIVANKEDDFSLASLMSGMKKTEEPEKKEERPAKKTEKKEKTEKTEKAEKPKKNKEEKKAEETAAPKQKEEKKAEPAVTEQGEPAAETKEEPKPHKKKKKKKPAKDKKPEVKTEEAKDGEEKEEDQADTSNEILSYLTEEELPERAVNALAYLKEIVKALGFEKVEYAFGKTERGVRFILSGEDAPSLIGRRGETMDALQYLCTVGSSREGGEYCRISIDIEGYRSRREEALTELAAKTAAKVKKNGYKQTLDPMNPYERRIVHAAIQEIEGVTSFSVGSEPFRKVVVALEGASQERKGGRKGGKRGGSSRGSRSRKPAAENTEQTVTENVTIDTEKLSGQAYEVIASVPKAAAEVKKPIPVKKELKSTEEFVGALYGKIEL